MNLPTRDRVTSTTIGPYTLERRLGKGGMGEVYRAYDNRLRRRVAIKQVLAEKAERANLRQRFRREARTVARLNHSAIVQIYDILETEEGDWIVMELVEGRTVRDLVDSGELPLPRAIRIAREVATGLAVAHDKGIVHRDLKLENVMVTEKGHAKILDFGLAKELKRQDPGDTTLSGEGMVVGTIRALSPEQIMEQDIDTRSDLFSFGTLLYEICTGESPFKAESIVTTMTKVCRHRQPPVISLNPEVSKELSDFIDSLLEKDRERRPQSVLEVVRFFDRLTGETTVLPPLEGWAGTAPQTAVEEPTGPADEDRRPQLAVAAAGDIAIKTLVSVQVANRAGLAERLGNDAAEAALARLDEARAALAKEHLGQESETEDGAVIAFERPAAAVEFALAYHRKVSALARELEAPIAVRQGIHLGEVTLDSNGPDPATAEADFTGPSRRDVDAAQLTALVSRRVMELARAGQVLFTHSVDEQVKKSTIARQFGDQEVTWKEHGLYKLPGVAFEVELFEVGFAGDASFLAPVPSEAKPPGRPWRARTLPIAVVLAVVLVGSLWARGCF